MESAPANIPFWTSHSVTHSDLQCFDHTSPQNSRYFFAFFRSPQKRQKRIAWPPDPSLFLDERRQAPSERGALGTGYKGRQPGYDDTYSSKKIHVLGSVFSHPRSECILLNSILLSNSGDKQPTYHKSSYFMQWAAAWALVKTLQASPARLKGVSSPNEPRHLSCSLHQQQNPFIDNKKIGNDYWTVNGLNPLGEALPITTFPGPGGDARKGRDLISWSTGGGVGAGGSTWLLVPKINAKGMLENLSRGMRMAKWNMIPPTPHFTTLCRLC